MTYDRVLLQLPRLLDAVTEQQVMSVLAEVAIEAGGTTFSIVGPARPSSFAVVRGLIGWCEEGKTAPRGPSLPFGQHPLFWGAARASGVHATGTFRIGDADHFEPVDGLLAPLPTVAGWQGAMLLRVDTTGLCDTLTQLLVTFCLIGSQRLSALRGNAPERDELSAREFEVLRWMAGGKSAEDVAGILGISAATVMFHYRGVATRYGTLNRAHTIVEALRRGALRLD